MNVFLLVTAAWLLFAWAGYLLHTWAYTHDFDYTREDRGFFVLIAIVGGPAFLLVSFIIAMGTVSEYYLNRDRGDVLRPRKNR